MALNAIDSVRELLNSSLSNTMFWDEDNNLSLLPSNLFPNSYLTEFSEDGSPEAYDLSGLPKALTGYHVNVSRPGRPRRDSMTRQTTARLPLEDAAWTSEGPIIRGYRSKGTDERKPLPPEITTVPSGQRGFAPGTYGYCWGVSGARRKDATPTTAITYFTLSANQRPLIPVPESFPQGTLHWDLYLTRPNKGAGSLALQERVPLRELRGLSAHELRGPWRNRGKRPTKNESGFGTPAKVRIPQDARIIPAQFDLRAGYYTLYLQLKNGRGTSLLSPISKRIKVAGDVETYQEKVSVEEPATTTSAVLSEPGGSGGSPSVGATSTNDPEEWHQAEGKRESSPYVRAGGRYMGEEVDAEESRLVGLINERRRASGLSDVVIDQSLNRMAYRGVEGPQSTEGMDYADETEYDTARTVEDSADEAFEVIQQLSNRHASSFAGFAAVGVAREPDEGGFRWCVVYGDTAPRSRAENAFCETVEADGTIHRHRRNEDGSHEYVETIAPDGSVMDAPVRTNVMNEWDLVQVENNTGRMNYAYSGSYARSLNNAAGEWHALKKVSVKSVSSGSEQVTITDGSLPDGTFGRAYSDGRIIGNASMLARASGNANQAMWAHELGHCLGFEHYTAGPSVMNTPIYLSETTNNDAPTSYDRQEYQSRWGHLTDSGEEPTTEPTPEQEYEWVTKTRVLPVKKGAGIFCRAPNVARKNPGVDYTYWVFYEPPDAPEGGTPETGATTGGGTFYRARRRRAPALSYFHGSAGTRKRRGITIHGYAPEEEPSGLAVGLVQEEPPTEDTSVIPAPDPTTIPDDPEIGGLETPPAGTYLADVQGVTESGALTDRSEPARRDLELGRMLKVTPPRTTNLLKNAEFSRLDAQDKPEDWTLSNVGSGTLGLYSVSEGVVRLDTSAPTTTMPEIRSDPVGINPDEPLTVSGEAFVSRYVSGEGGVRLVEYDEAGTILTATALVRATATGYQDFRLTFGNFAGGTPFAAGAHSVRLVVRMYAEEGFSANLAIDAYNLKLLGLPSDVRKYEVLEDGRATFDVSPATPLRQGSFVVSGPPKPPPGDISEEEPAIEVVSFESGAWNTDWNVGGDAGTVGVGGAIHGSNGWRIVDTSASRIHAFRRKTFSGEPLDGTSMGLRTLMRIDRLPTEGEVSVLALLDGSDRFLGRIVLRSDGRLLLDAVDGTRISLANVSEGQTMDLEIVVAQVNTRQGVISVGIGFDGSPREAVATLDGVDFRSRVVRTSEVGVSASTDPRSRWSLNYDQVVVSERGDILDREQPAPSPGYAPPPPDRPTFIGEPREFTPPDADGNTERIGQVYAFLAPGEARGSDAATINVLEDHIPVKPGLGYTFGIFSRWSVFTENPSPGVRLWLEGDGLEPILAASLGEMAGARGWHPVNEEDDFATFTVPRPEVDEQGNFLRGYTRLKVDAKLHDGVYVFQEPLLAQGIYTDFASRDAKRGFGCAISGTASFILDSRPPHLEAGIDVGTFWTDFGVRQAERELPAGNSIAALYGTTDSVLYSPDMIQDPQMVTPRRFLRVDLDFTGDGINSPVVSAGGVHLRTWHPIGTLLRADGSHFDGVAVVGNSLYDTEYPEVEIDRVGGHLLFVEKTEAIGRMHNIRIDVFTESAMREIESLTGEPFRIALPTARGEVRGMEYLVLLGEQVDFAGNVRDVPPMIWQGARRLIGYAEVAEAEILEAASQGQPLPSGVPVTAGA